MSTDAALMSETIVAQRFTELVLADEELLQDEFDAIVAANWPDPPQRVGLVRRRGQRRVRRSTPVRRHLAPALQLDPHERSPPRQPWG